jgi:hypothetical protein
MRKLAEAHALTDVGRQKVAPRAECSTTDGSPVLATSVPETVVETDADELHGGHDPVGDADPRTVVPRPRRVVAGDLAAALAAPAWARAITFLEGLALWLNVKLRVVLSVDARDAGLCLGLTDEMGIGLQSVYFDVEIHDRGARRRRGQRIRGIGDFADLRQLRLWWLGSDGN